MSVTSQGGTISIERDRFDRLSKAVALASTGAFHEAVTLLEDEGNDEFTQTLSAVRHFVSMLLSNAIEKEEILADLQMSQSRLQETLEQLEQKHEMQQLTIQDLGTPIIDLWDDIITLPIIGFIDSQRAVAMIEKLLQRIVESRCRCVIVDLTGVDTIDSMTADHLVKMTKAAKMLGAFCTVTGIGPEIAQTLVNLDIALGVPTLRTLKEGLQACFAHLQRFERTGSSLRT